MINRNGMILLFMTTFVAFSPRSSPWQDQSQHRQPKSPEPVLIAVQVLSKKTGRFVEGLKKEEISIYESGSKQEVTQFSQEGSPVSIILLLDVSGSMRFDTKLIQDVAVESLRSLRAEDEVSLMTFAEGARVIVKFTKDKKLIKENIEKFNRKEIHGPTYEREGLYAAAKNLDTAANLKSGRIIIVITDNVSNNYMQPHSEKEVLNELVRSGAIVYGMIVPSNEPQPVAQPGVADKESIRAYVEKTGGTLLSLRDREARRKIDTMVDNAHKRYSLKYEPSSSKRNSRHPEIRLRVSPSVEKREGTTEILFRLIPKD